MEGALVNPILLWHLRLHLKPAADRVERIRDGRGDDRDDLREDERHEDGAEVDLPRLALLVTVRIDALKSVEEAKIRRSVEEDADDGDAVALVERRGSVGARGLRQARARQCDKPLLISSPRRAPPPEPRGSTLNILWQMTVLF